MLLEEVPVVDVVTTVHFPDVGASYFRSLLDFLYSGQTCVPANDVEHLHDLLDLLQIKPGVWRTSSKDGGGKNLPGEKVEVLGRLYPDETNSKIEAPQIDINSNEGADSKRRRSSEGRETVSPVRLSVKRERINESSCDDDRDELDDDIEEEILDKKNFITNQQQLDRDDGSNDDDTLNEADDEEYDDNEAKDCRKFHEIIPRDMIGERRRSSSDPVNLSLGLRDRDEDSNEDHIDVESIGNAPSKVKN